MLRQITELTEVRICLSALLKPPDLEVYSRLPSQKQSHDKLKSALPRKYNRDS